MKKLVSLFLAVLMLFTSMSTGLCAFADNTPYVDNDGYYHRISFGEYITFDTDYQRVLNEVYQHFKNHDTSFTVMYATSNTEYGWQPKAHRYTARQHRPCRRATTCLTWERTMAIFW